MSDMNVVGIDIGYSNLKVAYGTPASGMKTVIRPAGAAPSNRFGMRFDGKMQDEFLHVTVNGEQYIAGVSTDRAESWERSLHANYVNTDSYMALYYGGLLLTEMSEIDFLVTGLPVNQFQDEDFRLALQKKLTGIHQITPKKSINVKNVIVIAQPTGALIDMLQNKNDLIGENYPIEKARVLVVDPGFFSLDWIMVNEGELVRQSSGTSTSATSVLLEKAGSLIAVDYGNKPTVEKLEAAIRAGENQILSAGDLIEIEPYLVKASEALAHVSTSAIQKSLRVEQMSPDIILLGGGGSGFFSKAFKDAYEKLRVITPDDPVLANARGFWWMGLAYAEESQEDGTNR